MVRDIFTNRWILGGLGFLIIFTGLCYIWYQHTTAPYREQAAELNERARRSEKQRTATTAKRTEPAADAPAESETPTAEKSINESTAEVENNTEAVKERTETSAENAVAKDVPVSPFGFGPYPQVPAGMLDTVGHPYKPVWEDASWSGDPSIGSELISRVLIKAWKDGIRDYIGAGFYPEYNKVFLNYPNTVYVTWDKTEDDDGNTVLYITRMSGSPSAAERIRENSFTRLGRPGPATEADIPSDIKVILHSEGGIDPYEYLNLPKK